MYVPCMLELNPPVLEQVGVERLLSCKLDEQILLQADVHVAIGFQADSHVALDHEQEEITERELRVSANLGRFSGKIS